MAKGKRTGAKDSGRAAVITLIALVALVAASLTIRWGGILPPDEALFGEIRLEVQNGTGEPGLAKRIALELRQRGVDVLLIGDAESYDFPRTLLVDRRGGSDKVRRLARVLGCKRIIEQVQERPLVDATLIIGRDYEGLRFGGGS